MTFGRLASLIGVALLVLITNVAISVLYMVVYGQVAGPYCSIVAGMPLMFFAGWWVAGWWQQKLGIIASLGVWLAYAIIDLAIILVGGITLEIGALFGISFVSKLAAAWYGGAIKTRKKN